jgi:hypothetical protein
MGLLWCTDYVVISDTCPCVSYFDVWGSGGIAARYGGDLSALRLGRLIPEGTSSPVNSE